jgi:hypothetical protein
VSYHCSERSCPTADKIDVKGSSYEETECAASKFAKCHMKILLGDLYVNVRREDISKHKMGNNIEMRIVNTDIRKNLRVKSTIISHRNIYKYTWTSPDGKTHNKIDHILVDRRRHSNVLDVRSFRAADCDSDHYLVVAKVRERLAVNKQRSRRFHMDRFNLKKIDEVED